MVPDQPPAGAPAAPAGGPDLPRPDRSPKPPNLAGILIVAAAALVAVVVTFGVFLPAIGALGDPATTDPATLPGAITVCDREWTRDPLARELTRDEVFARTEAEPIVVEIAPFPSCPPAARGSGDAGGMAPAVYVLVGDDAYVGYTLVGDP